MTAEDISVVVPVSLGGPAFARCCDALVRLDPTPGEVVVVADGAADEDVREAHRRGFRVLAITGPGGPARARNAGARIARGRILFFVDADVVVPADAIARVAGVFSAPAAPVAFFGSYDAEPGDPGFLSQYRNLLHHFVHQTSRRKASTFWGACGAIERDVFLEIGGFDEAYRFPSIEDVELGRRLHRAGHDVRLVPEFQVKHLKRWTLRTLLVSDLCHRALPWTRLILRERALPDDLNLGRSSRLSVALAALAAAGALLAPWMPWSLAAVGACGLGIIGLNAPLYRFLWVARGVAFAIRVVPWHGLYLLCCAAAFAWGVAESVVRRAPRDLRRRCGTAAP